MLNKTNNTISNEQSLDELSISAFKALLNNDSIKLCDKVSKGVLQSNYDCSYYNDLLMKIQALSSSQRDLVVLNAIFLSMIFPHMPYFWGGGHQYNIKGVDPLWGTKKVLELHGDDNTGKVIPYGLDCSGFIDWVLYNSDFDSDKVNCFSTTSSYLLLGVVEKISSKNIISRIKAGDLVYMDRHAGIIIAKNSKDIIVAHCSGSGNGMNLTSIDTETGLVVDDSNRCDRVGKEYFTCVIEMDYNEKK